jgi:hypothetical protein
MLASVYDVEHRDRQRNAVVAYVLIQWDVIGECTCVRRSE